jgi:hypothetical protein
MTVRIGHTSVKAQAREGLWNRCDRSLLATPALLKQDTTQSPLIREWSAERRRVSTIPKWEPLNRLGVRSGRPVDRRQSRLIRPSSCPGSPGGQRHRGPHMIPRTPRGRPCRRLSSMSAATDEAGWSAWATGEIRLSGGSWDGEIGFGSAPEAGAPGHGLRPPHVSRMLLPMRRSAAPRY